MNNCLISILVPVYKVEDYLHRCIDSVLSQDFQDWELILVDDGSPDRCPQICDEYARKDERISVIHKENGGLVSARLAGYKRSIGQYLMFLDSDDYLLPNALSVLYDKIREGYDLVRGAYKFTFSDSSEKSITKNFGEFKGGNAFRKMLIFGQIDSFLWGALYKRSIFEASSFGRLIGLSVGEDWCLNFIIADKIESIYVVDNVVYAYWMNDGSMMHQTIPSHHYVERMHQPLLEYLSDNHDEMILHLLEAHRVAAHVNLSFYYESTYDDEYRKALNDFMKKFGKDVITSLLLHPYYLWFRNSRFYYRCFCRFVAFLVKYKKYKGKTRKVID